MSSANVTVESPSAQQNSDSASSSYANVVLNLKTPREDKNDNNKENIEKDVNLNKHQSNTPAISDVPPVDKRTPTEDLASTTTTVNSTSTTQIDQQELIDNDDDESFIPVVSHSRKERKVIRKEKPSRDRAVTLKQQRRLDSTEAREKRDSKRSKDRPDAAAKELAKTDTPLDSTSPKMGNEDEAENVPVKFVEAPIPATNAWKVNISSSGKHSFLHF